MGNKCQPFIYPWTNDVQEMNDIDTEEEIQISTVDNEDQEQCLWLTVGDTEEENHNVDTEDSSIASASETNQVSIADKPEQSIETKTVKEVGSSEIKVIITEPPEQQTGSEAEKSSEVSTIRSRRTSQRQRTSRSDTSTDSVIR